VKALRNFGRNAPSLATLGEAPPAVAVPQTRQATWIDNPYLKLAAGTLAMGALTGYVGYRVAPRAPAVGAAVGAAAGGVGGFLVTRFYGLGGVAK
jgi:uncharacterized membrane protein